MDFSTVLKSFSKVKNVAIDNCIFQLHYKVSFTIFLICFIAAISSQYFGNPIHCMGDYETEVSGINSYCFNGKSYIITNPDPRHVAIGNIEPQAIGTLLGIHKIRYLTSFRWLPWFLALQTLSFCLTHFVWKIKEKGTIVKLLCPNMNNCTHEEWIARRQAISRKIANQLGLNKTYWLTYVVLEITNLFVALANLWVMDAYLEVSFYGLHAVGLLPTPGVLTFKTLIFPAAAKCSFSKGGPGGNPSMLDFICLLPHSHLYSEMFTVLWFWCLILALLSAIGIIIRITIISFKKCQVSRLNRLAPLCDRRIIEELLKGGGFGDYLILIRIGNSLLQYEFKEVLIATNHRLKHSV